MKDFSVCLNFRLAIYPYFNIAVIVYDLVYLPYGQKTKSTRPGA